MRDWRTLRRTGGLGDIDRGKKFRLVYTQNLFKCITSLIALWVPVSALCSLAALALRTRRYANIEVVLSAWEFSQQLSQEIMYVET